MFITYYYQILLNSPVSSVVCGPRNVLRDKQGHLIKQKHEIINRSMYNDDILKTVLCIAFFYVLLKLQF